MVTYYGLNFEVIAASRDASLTLDCFKRCLMQDEPFKLIPSETFYNTRWAEQEIKNSGFWTVNAGSAEGMVIGGNFLTFNFMQGTPFAMRDDPTSALIYILEDNGAESVYNFQNQLQLLILQPNFRNVRGILIGTFRRESNTTRDLLTKIIKTKEELRNVPVIAKIDFGQIVPTVTLPIVGYMRIEAKDNSDEIFILKK